jgi:hypothetical protein
VFHLQLLVQLLFMLVAVAVLHLVDQVAQAVMVVVAMVEIMLLAVTEVQILAVEEVVVEVQQVVMAVQA